MRARAALYRPKRRAKRRRTCHESAVTMRAQKRAKTKSTPATVVSAGPSAVYANQARSAAPATEGAFMMTAAAQIHPGRAKEAALRIRCSACLLTSLVRVRLVCAPSCSTFRAICRPVESRACKCPCGESVPHSERRPATTRSFNVRFRPPLLSFDRRRRTTAMQPLPSFSFGQPLATVGRGCVKTR
jgi:hypothetical protein